MVTEDLKKRSRSRLQGWPNNKPISMSLMFSHSFCGANAFYYSRYLISNYFKAVVINQYCLNNSVKSCCYDLFTRLRCVISLNE